MDENCARNHCRLPAGRGSIVPGRLRVALDMRPTSELGTGIARYARNLADALAAGEGVELHLLHKYADDAKHVPGATVMCATERNWLQGFVPRYCRENIVDVFHGTNFVAPLMAPVRRVVTVHDMTLFNPGSGHRLRTFLVHGMQSLLSLVVADAVVTDSRATATALGARFPWLRSLIHHIPLGVGSQFRPSPLTSPLNMGNRSESTQPFILNVGKQERRKNLPLLIKGFARECRDPQWIHDLVLVGPDGGASSDVRRAIKDAGVADRIRMLGVVSDAELVGLYRRASLVVYPSAVEGFGLPVLEAMACGVPVVTLADPSVLEVAGAAALIVPVATAEAIAHALRSGVQAGPERNERIRLGLIRAASHRWETVASATLDVYNAVARDRLRFGTSR